MHIERDRNWVSFTWTHYVSLFFTCLAIHLDVVIQGKIGRQRVTFIHSKHTNEAGAMTP